MSFQFIEVSVSSVRLDPTQVEQEDDGFIYNHLKRYLSKSTRLPAISVKSEGNSLISAGRHKYLQIARDLGFDRIRAVIQDETFEELKARGVPGLLSVVPKSELDREQKSEIVDNWHVFFFKAPPSSEMEIQIVSAFRDFLRRTLPEILGNDKFPIESHFDRSAPCFEIRFLTPVTNRSWADSYHAFISTVSHELLPIETYQGRRFKS